MMTSTRKRRVGGALILAGIAVTGVAGPTTFVAGATPPGGPYTWCPGDPPVETGNKRTNPVIWDESVCHEYWFVYFGQGNVAQNIWDGPNPPGEPPGMGYKPPPPLPPGWCWPTNGTFIPVPYQC